MPASFRRAAILGTGLIGGSFALALRRAHPDTVIVGWDRAEVLHEAQLRGAIHESAGDLPQALRDADLVYVALPVGLTVEMLPDIVRHAAPGALVTDAGSTKRAVCAQAAKCFAAGARFLGGHPMAGKEVSGIAAADAELFRGAKYALIANSSAADMRSAERVAAFVALIELFGAEPVWLDADTHDRAAAVVSHLPQLLAVALAGVVREETDVSGFPVKLAGRGLRDMLRLAGSPYSVWRDILVSNADHVDRTLAEFMAVLERLRGELRSAALEKEFTGAGELYKILRDQREK